MFYETISFSSDNIKDYNYAAVSSLVMNTTALPILSEEDSDFYKRTREALDRVENSDVKGISESQFLDELDSW